MTTLVLDYDNSLTSIGSEEVLLRTRISPFTDTLEEALKTTTMEEFLKAFLILVCDPF